MLARPAALCLALAILGPAGPASAQGVALRTSTVLTASQRPYFNASDTRSQVPLWQFVELITEDVGIERLTVELSGVLGAHLNDRPLADGLTRQDRVQGNVLVGLVRWRSRKNALSIAAGRQYLFAGAGRAEQLDGLNIRYRTPWRVDVSVFGGRTRPWQLDDTPSDGVLHVEEDVLLSNWAVGGQLRYRLLDSTVASVGFLHEGHEDETLRQNLSFQLGYWGLSQVEGLAGGIVDVADGRLQEMWASVTSRAVRNLKLGLDYAFQVPSLTIAKTSLFSVFSLADYHKIGGSAYYAITSRLLAGVEGGARLYDDGDEGGELELGYQAAGSLRLTLGPERQGMIGLHSELVDASDQWSLQNRLFARYRHASGLYGNAEVYLLALGADRKGDSGSTFERRIDAKRLSLGGLLLAGYALGEAWSLQVAGSVFSTPLAQHDVRLLSRLTYNGFWGKSR